MQRRLLDVLADPDDPQQWPLKLKILKEEIRERKHTPHPHDNGLLCQFYCHLKGEYLVSDPLGKQEAPLSKEKIDQISYFDQCIDCIKTEIIDGIIYHENFKTKKWFIIDREIPVMFPIELRDKKIESDFFIKYPDEAKELGFEL